MDVLLRIHKGNNVCVEGRRPVTGKGQAVSCPRIDLLGASTYRLMTGGCPGAGPRAAVAAEWLF